MIGDPGRFRARATPSVGKRESLLLCAVAVLALVATSASGATVTGKVTDAALGTPLPSMIVAAYNSSGQLQGSATSDATGRYSLPLTNGSYRLLAYDNAGVYATTFNGDASSFEATPITIVSVDLSNINFALKRAGYIAGVVTTTTGSPGGLIVAAYNLDGSRRGFTTTNASGAYTLALPPGPYRVAAYDDDGFFAPSFFPDVLNVNALLTIVANLRLDAAAHLTGTIVDQDTGQPVAGVTAAAFDANGTDVADMTTGATGAYDIHLPAGAYRLGAFDVRNQYITTFLGGGAFGDSPVLALTSGQTRSNLLLTMIHGASLGGKVMDINGNPIVATVGFYGRDGSLRQKTSTSMSGAFSVLLPPAEYRIAAYDETFNYVTQFYAQQPTFESATPVILVSGQTVTTPLLFALSRGAHISGMVTDASTGAAVPGITIGAYNTFGDLIASATSAADGSYGLMLFPGTYKLVAFDGSLRYAAVFAGGTSFENAGTYGSSASAVDFRMTRGAHVKGVVRDVAGNGLTGIEVSALDVNGNHAGTATSLDGNFELVLIPGTYRLVAVDPLSRFTPTSLSSPLLVSSSGTAESILLTLGSHGRRRSVSH